MVFQSSQPKEQPNQAFNNLISELSKRLNDNTRRIRVLEEQLGNQETRLNDFEQRLVDETASINKRAANVETKNDELLGKIANVEVDLKKINKQMEKLVTRKEVKELQEYVELMSPISSKFTTRKEVEEMINQKTNERF